MLNVDISDTIDRGELFGGLDKNLKLIEDNFNVDIIQRDTQLILKGDRTSQAEKIIKEMMGVLEKGEKLDEQKISYIADLSDKGMSYGNEKVGSDIICFTHEGKPLRPKTIGRGFRYRSGRNGKDVHRGGYGRQRFQEQGNPEDNPGQTGSRSR